MPSDMAFRHMVLGTVCNGDRDFWKLRCNPLRGNNLKKGEIRFLAMRPMKDEYGNEHLYVDEDMRLRLEAKLLYSIVTGFKVLPV